MLEMLLLSGIAEFFFNWNAFLVFVIGLIIDIILGVIVKKKNTIFKVALILIFALALILSGLIMYIENNCTYIPHNITTGMPLNQVQRRALECDLCCSEENIHLDNNAQEKYALGIPLDNPCFYVNNISPLPGTLVKKNSAVDLTVSWKSFETNEQENTANDKKMPEILKTVPDPYSNYDPNSIVPINTNELSISATELAAIVYNERGEKYTVGINPEQPVLVQFDLINLFDGTPVQTLCANMGEQVHFTNIPDGVYFFKISSEGYKTYVDEMPFALNYDSSKEKSTIATGVDLERNDITYGSEFRVRISNPYAVDKPEGYASLYVTAALKGKNNYSQFTPITVNEEGYLSTYGWTNDIWYDSVAHFIVADGYTLFVANHDLNYTKIVNPGFDGISTLTY